MSDTMSKAPEGNLALMRLAERARLGDLAAMRGLHFPPNAVDVSPKILAAREAADIIGRPILIKFLYRNGEPKPRAVPPGGIDFYRIHCMALDRLPALLDLLLPHGEDTGGYWLGTHPDRPEWIEVNLFTGAWRETNTTEQGRDLVSLFGHMFGFSPIEAARALWRWMGGRGLPHAQ